MKSIISEFRLFVVLFALLLGRKVHGDAYNYWTYYGDGCYTNENCWLYKGVANWGAGVRNYIGGYNGGIAKTFTVTFPEGVVTNLAAIRVSASPGHTVTLDGRNSELYRPWNDLGNNPDTPFAAHYKALSSVLFSLYAGGATPNVGKAPEFALSNFLFKVSSDSENHVRSELTAGHFNAFNPYGVTWTSTVSPRLTMFDAADLTRCEVVFSGTSETILPTLMMQGTSVSNALVFAGGRHSVNGYVYLPFTQGIVITDNENVTDLVFENGADVTFKKATMVGTSGDAKGLRRHWNYRVRTGAVLNFDASLTHSFGQFSFLADAATINAGSGFSLNCVNNTSSARFTLANGAVFNGTNDSASVLMGQTAATVANSWFEMTNAMLRTKGNVYLGPGRVTGSRLELTGAMSLRTGGGENAVLTFDDSEVVTTSYGIYPGAISSSRLVLTNSTLALNGNMYIGGVDVVATTAATGVVDVCGSDITLSGDQIRVIVGYPAKRYGVLTFGPGATFTGVNRVGGVIDVGWFGRGRLNVCGGTVRATHVATGSTYTEGSDTSIEDVIRVTSGTLFCDTTWLTAAQATGLGLKVAGNAHTRGRLVLDGGLVRARAVYGGDGVAVLEANGGTLQAIESTAGQLQGFDEATLGPKGLTIDSSGYNITVEQSFADKSGEEGRLVLAGAGEKKMMGDLSAVSEVVVVGGSAVLGETLGNLVVTNGATLKLDPSRTLVLSGGARFGEFHLFFTSAPEIGKKYTLFTAARPLSAASLAAWQALYVSEAEGRPAGSGLVFAQEEDGAGGYRLTLTVTAAQNIVRTLSEGTRTDAEDVSFGVYDTFTTDVGEGAVLTVTGQLGSGALAKIGLGKLVLDNAANVFRPGFVLSNGMISVADTASLGLAGDESVASSRVVHGALEVTGPVSGASISDVLVLEPTSTNDLFVIKNEVDLTMPCPNGSATTGEVMKRGAGRLELTVTGAQTLCGGLGFVSTAGGFWPGSTTSVAPLVFDAVNGMVTAGYYPPLSVVEGELRVKGTEANAVLQVNGSAVVGLPTETGTVQPGLVLDGVKMDVGKDSFFLSACVNYLPRQIDFATTPYLILTNGATLAGTGFQVERYSQADPCQARVEVDASTLAFTGWFRPSRGDGSAWRHPSFLFRNGSKCYAGTFITWHDVEMLFDNSILAKNASNAFLSIEPENPNIGGSTVGMTFRNGSKFYCSKIVPPTASLGSNRPLTFVFDDAEWIPSTGDYTFDWTDSGKVLLAVTNIGLRLDVPSAATWTMNQPLTGNGGIVKSGAGTLTFGTGALAYAGVTRADEGVVDLGGGMAASVAGAGTFRNGTVAGIRVLPDVLPTVEANVAFAARTKVDLGRAEPLESMETFDVLRYTGSAPDVSGFRLKGTGTPNLSGTFAVDAGRGVITCTPTYVGMILIVR